jgi:Ca2+-binding EF-hand superfamily protein
MAKKKLPSFTRAEQTKLCVEAFETYDPHKKGYLTRLELMAFASELNTNLGHENALNQIQENKIIKLLDDDGNGTVEEHELLQNFD